MINKETGTKKSKTPWPTKDAMEQVYAMSLWGGHNVNFYSGEGSHLPEILDSYIASVTSFLTSFKTPLIVCDLGCGDFNVGKQLVKHTVKYIAIDIVEDLISHNRATFTEDRIEFDCIDIAVNDLPSGDCAIVRQVLQHLSNAEIQSILKKLTAYKFVILTEHIPVGNFVPNKDIISGQGTRLKKQSGVDLMASPFYFEVKEEKKLVSVVLENNAGVIVTTIYTIF